MQVLSAQGHKRALSLGITCKDMTSDQIAEAQRLAREWMAKHGKAK